MNNGAIASLLSHDCTFTFFLLAEERYMTLNVHQLLHLPEVVNNLGPLWAHSCFPFESANGDLLKLFHGSRGVEKQVGNVVLYALNQAYCCFILFMQVLGHVNAIQILPMLADSLEKGSKEEELHYRMSTKSTRRYLYLTFYYTITMMQCLFYVTGIAEQ